jgi:glycosyltransferase involved in cell wall biosynthesis
MNDFRGRSFDPQNKLVTVAVGSYNHAPYVISTLESIYNQSYAPIELKIIDDASSDNSVAIIKEWIAKKEIAVQFILNDRNRGVCYVCNTLIKQPAYYLVLIGSDDEMEVDRLEKQIAYFETLGKEYGLVYSDMSTIDEKGMLVEASWFKSNGILPLEGDVFEPFLREQFRFPSPSIIYRSEVFKTVGEYDERLKTEDIDMVLRILRHYKVAYCPIVSVRYRVLSQSLSRNIGARLFQDRIMIYRKFLGFSESVDTYVKKKIVGWAQRAYYSDYPECKSLLIQSVRIQFTMKSFLLLLFAWCGVKSERLSKLIKLVKN